MRARWIVVLLAGLALLLAGCTVGYGYGYRTYGYGGYGTYYYGSPHYYDYDPLTGLYYGDPFYSAFGRPYYDRYPYYARPYVAPYPYAVPRGRVIVPYAPHARVVPRYGPQHRPPVVGTPGHPSVHAAPPHAHVAPRVVPPMRVVPPRGSITVPR